MNRILLPIILLLVFAFPRKAVAQINAEQVMKVGVNALYFEDYMLSIQYFNKAIEAKPYLARPYFYRAIAKLNLEDYRGAEADATEAIDRNPFLSDAYEVRGVARQNMGDNAGAVADYDLALRQLPDNRGIMFNKALALSDAGDNAGALSTLDQLLEVHPGFDAAYTGRAKVELALGDSVSALTDLDKALELNRNSANAYVMRADISMNRDRDYESALRDMNEAIKLQPRYAGYFVNRAFLRYNLEDYFGAMADYDYAIVLDPLNMTAYFNRGLLRAEVSDDDRAVEDFTKVLELDPDDVRARYNRSRILRRKLDYKGALADLDKVIAEYPDMSGLVFERFELLDNMGDRRGAMREYDRAIAMSKEEDRKMREAGARGNGDASEGKNSGAQSAQGGPAVKSGNSNPPGNTAGSSAGSSNSDGDIDNETSRKRQESLLANRFTTLLTTESELTDEREFNNKSIRGKVQDRDIAIRVEGDFGVSYYSSPTQLKESTYYMAEADQINESRELGMILQVTNSQPEIDDEETIARHFKKLDEYNRLIADGTPRAIDYFGRGMEHMTLRDYESAAADFTRALGLTPDFALAYFMRAVARHHVNAAGSEAPSDAMLAAGEARTRYASMLADYDEALRLAPRMATACFNKGNIYLETGDLTSAISSYSEAIKLHPDFGEAYYNRGYVYFKLGNRDNGVADLSRAGELGIVPSYSLLKRMGR